ncbi:hypothetical protein FRB91_009315 [Serendipita sp. 411]|nr:hypothetical protein FRB91_009315 [Serendipita sp. 411]
MSITQIDLLEAIPFVRDISALDLLDLPQGLFESLPKPCNLKRSAASGGPIWPPVLTKVLCDGLLVLHHKQHLVGKQGLDEHYNWLSAFIYRQTRGWDPNALAHNNVRIDPKRLIGIIRNRKQISSKVQTIGEYLKETHWAYVVQGPRQAKDTLQPTSSLVSGLPQTSIGNSEAQASSPAVGPVDTKADPPRISSPQTSDSRSNEDHSRSLDLSRVSLELVPLPPTPFSLPSTPNHSPFLYPSDVPDFEYSDAQVLGYDPSAWPEFEAQYRSITESQPLPAILGTGISRLREPCSFYEGDITLHSTSLNVHISSASGQWPSQQESHQVGLLPPGTNGSLQKVHISAFDPSTQLTIRHFHHSANKLYHVDLPVYLPSSTEDRLLLTQKLSSGYHVNAATKFCISSTEGDKPLNARDDLMAESYVYYIDPLKEGQNVLQQLPGYDETSYLSMHQGESLVAPGPASSFIAHLWSDALKDPHYSTITADLSKYKIVQKISSTTDRNALLIVVYSLKRATIVGQSAVAALVPKSPESNSMALSSSETIHTPGESMPITRNPNARASVSRSPNISSRVHARGHSYSPLMRGGQNMSKGIIHSSPRATPSPRMSSVQGSIGPVRTLKTHVASRTAPETVHPYSVADEGRIKPRIGTLAQLPLSPMASPEIAAAQRPCYVMPRPMSAGTTHGTTSNILPVVKGTLPPNMAVSPEPTDGPIAFSPFAQTISNLTTSAVLDNAEFRRNTPPSYEYSYGHGINNVSHAPQRNFTYPIPSNVHYAYLSRSLPYNSGGGPWAPQYSLKHN